MAATATATTRVSIPIPTTYTRNDAPEEQGKDDTRLQLEGLMRMFGTSASQPHLGLLIVHPYSLLGGSMYDAVVMEVFRQGQASRHFGSVMTYNMRGVGKSQGAGWSRLATMASRLVPASNRPHWMTRDCDALDLSHVIEYMVMEMERNTPSVRGKAAVAIVGYSYGAALAAQAVHHPRVCRYVGISIPVGKMASLFLKTKRYCLDMATMHTMPRLLVLGKDDQYTSEQQLVQLLLQEDMTMAVGATGMCRRFSISPCIENSGNEKRKPEVYDIVLDVFENNDHFWGNDCACMIEHVLGWLVAQDCS